MSTRKQEQDKTKTRRIARNEHCGDSAAVHPQTLSDTQFPCDVIRDLTSSPIVPAAN